MTLLVPNGFAVCKLVYSLQDSPGYDSIITYGVENLTGNPAATLALNLWSAAVQTGSIGDAASMNSLWALTSSQVALKVSGAFISAQFDDVEAGSISNAVPSLQVAALMQKHTGLGGRKGKGRCYLPPALLDEGDINEIGTIDSTARAALQDKCEFWLDYIDNTLNLDMVLFHNDGVTAPTSVTAVTVEGTVATQRRRLRR